MHIHLLLKEGLLFFLFVGTFHLCFALPPKAYITMLILSFSDHSPILMNTMLKIEVKFSFNLFFNLINPFSLLSIHFILINLGTLKITIFLLINSYPLGYINLWLLIL